MVKDPWAGIGAMFVRDRMTTRPLTVPPETSVMDALELMRRNKVRRLPVMAGDSLVGIVTELDLLHVSPSPATSLSVFEINYLVSKMRVKDAMTTDVITVSPDDTVEKAAMTMRENKIGGLPVMEGKKLVGIITETNIFDAFLEMLGVTKVGVRITVDVPDRKGVLADLTDAIRDADANIISLATFGLAPGRARIVLRLEPQNADAAADAISARGFELVHKTKSYVQF
ncbi:MAG: CBS and ACT domain-containing protein [Firmicutes bacterium]|jgi:acetoin utilization protein AcuB|nr:CBS and ACT domain-containing protein [Bacillota bacterium]